MVDSAHQSHVEQLARLGRLHLQVRRLIEAEELGSHAARGRRGGGDFFEHRAFRSGDEVGRIDWRASARGDQLLMRERRAERQLRVVVMLDSSGSMSTGEPVTKWRYGCWLGLGTAYAARRAGDRAELLVRAGEPEGNWSLRSIGDMEHIGASLEAIEPSGTTDFLAAFEDVAGRQSRGLLVVVSDLLEADEAFWSALTEQRLRGWHVAVLRVLARDELTFDHRGPIRFEGAEGGEPLTVDAGAVRVAYIEELHRFDAECEAAAARAGARLILCDTGEHPIRPLRALLEEPLP